MGIAPRRRRAWAIVAIGLALAAWGVHVVTSDLESLGELDEMRTEVHGNEGSVDLGALAARAPSAVAWVSVGGTGIDLPVCKAPADDPDFYLAHDQVGSTSRVGVPFIAPNADADDPVVMVFGHHLAVTGGSFSELFDMHRRDAFERIEGRQTIWTTQGQGELSFLPLCAIQVDKEDERAGSLAATFAPIPRDLLLEILASADARAKGGYDLLRSAKRCLSLVTCSSIIGGQRWRTVVVFVSEGRPGEI